MENPEQTTGQRRPQPNPVGSRERLRTFAVAEQFTDKPEQLAVGEGFARGNSGDTILNY